MNDSRKSRRSVSLSGSEARSGCGRAAQTGHSSDAWKSIVDILPLVTIQNQTQINQAPWYINTTIALNAPVLLVKAVPEPRAENSAFHLPAHHVTSPDTSRGATQHARLKSVQSQNAPSLFPCAKSLRRRISSQIGWLTQNSEPSSQPADPRDGARDGLDAPAHRSAPGLTSHTRSGQRQVDISRQLLSRRRLQAGNYN